MIEGFRNNAASLVQLMTAVKNGRGCQAHDVTGLSESSVAAFLIGAGHNSFLGLGSWDAGDPSTHRSPVFDLPLGNPVADAVNASGVWTRSFDHVNVTFNEASGQGTVDGWVWPPAPPPPAPPGPAPTPPQPTAMCPVIKTDCSWQHFDLKTVDAKTWEDCCASCHGATNCTKWVFHDSSLQCKLHASGANAGVGGTAICGQMSPQIPS
jgi:hypothetical protein